MSSFAADAITLAAGAAGSLAGILDQLAAGLQLPDPPGAQLRSDAALITDVLVPSLETAAEVAAIGVIVAGDAILVGQAAVTNGQQATNSPILYAPGAPTARDAAPAFYAAATATNTALPMIASPGRGRAAGLARALCAAAEASFLGQAFLAEAQSNFADRQSAQDASQRIQAAMDAASDRIAGAIGGSVFAILATAAAQANAHIAAAAADLRPVVVVTAPRSFPATALAYALYGDPARAAELVARNNCGTSLFMPPTFEALAPSKSV
jgi:hypothetical protein